MKQEFSQHIWAYVVLAAGLILGTVLFLAAWPQHQYQRVVGLGIGCFYFVWGTLTHIHAQKISRRVMLEYFTVGALVAAVLWAVTW